MTKIIISGGGTGGHVYPAIAIANALKAKEEDMDILFIGAQGRMEMEKVPAAGYRIEGLKISGFQRKFTWKNLTFPFKLAVSLMKARKIITHFKPDAVIGVGGYASGPTLRLAASRGIPCLIQEQNSFPGMTNRLLAEKVRTICVAYPGMEKFFPVEKIRLTGNPIRQDLVNLTGKEKEARAYFGFKDDEKVVLVLGGSLGAANINKAMLKFIGENVTSEIPFQIIWQTGNYYYEAVYKNLQNEGCRVPGSSLLPNEGPGGYDFRHPASGIGKVVVVPFINRMDLAYSIADLIVSRAGAIAISELSVIARPIILVPSPNVAEDHQTKNAEAFVRQKAALMVRDQDASEMLGNTIVKLINDCSLQQELTNHLRPLGIMDGAEKIAEETLKLLPGAMKKENRHLTLTPLKQTR